MKDQARQTETLGTPQSRETRTTRIYTMHRHAESMQRMYSTVEEKVYTMPYFITRLLLKSAYY